LTLVSVFRRQHQIGSTDILSDALGLARARNRHDVVALGKEPGERQL
jgi:hypothetical protein